MTRLLIFLVFALHSLPCIQLQEFNAGICQLHFCECSPSLHPTWISINCTVPPNLKLDIKEGDLPLTTSDIVVYGAEAVMFSPNSLTGLKDIRQIQIYNSNVALMRTSTAVDLAVISLMLKIENCTVLSFEEKTFRNIKGPVTISVKNCESVSVEKEAFSWLLRATLDQVKSLKLANGSFMLEPTASNTDEHGPEMTIELNNLNVDEIPTQTFGSSAASIIMRSINVLVIRQSAFSAIAYNTVMAINSTFHLIEGESFAQKALIQQLLFDKCILYQMNSGAVKSGVTFINITNSRIESIDTGAVVSTVAVVLIENSVFKTVRRASLEFNSYDYIKINNNSFDELPEHTFVTNGGMKHEVVFTQNEIENAHPHSLMFIGQAYLKGSRITYKNNYFGVSCTCDIPKWVEDTIDTPNVTHFIRQTFCTVGELVARCFNVPDENMNAMKFVDSVCVTDITIKCEPFMSKTGSNNTEFVNPRFPHKKKPPLNKTLNERDTKVIGIVVVSVLGCIIIVMLISLIRWLARRGYCMNPGNCFNATNSSCHYICQRFCGGALPAALDNTRSISQSSINEYSERRRLNDPIRVHDGIQESSLVEIPLTISSTVMSHQASDDKCTQTLPEELTKELLENLKANLEDPENYFEAREMIEHLYELIKVEESCHPNSPVSPPFEENIYELPFQNTAPRVGKNKKSVTSTGTKTPSLDKLLPLSPYNRQIALAHEYFEPKDFAVHLYAEITNSNKDRKMLMNIMPDILSEQIVPRGPYLMAIRDKINSNASSSTTTPSSPSKSFGPASPQHESTIQSNKSVKSNSSSKMVNRPLPQKPAEPVASTSKHI